jgi:VIT1/CCC1 family predicted Fe2+/Mn2+ transporter
MNSKDVKLFNYIAKVAAKSGDTVLAPGQTQTFEDIGPVSEPTEKPDKETEIAWEKWITGLSLAPILVWALRSIWKYLDPFCKRRLAGVLESLSAAMKKLSEAASQNEFAAAAEALRQIFQSLPKNCRDGVLENPEFVAELRRISDGMAITIEDLIGKYIMQKNQDDALRWLVNYGTSATTVAAVYLWALNQPGSSPSIAAEIAAWAETNRTVLWVIASAAVLFGLAAALSGVGLPVGIASGATGVILMALLAWLNQDPPQDAGGGMEA